jgi:hypothetical protein
MATRGACSEALAVEVYGATMVRVHRMFGRFPRLSQVIPDAVGEAFVRWLQSCGDKSEHVANHHVWWVTRNAGNHLLDTAPTKRRVARAIRLIASYAPDDNIVDNDRGEFEAERFEARLRRHKDAASLSDCEDNIIEALDAVRAVSEMPDALAPDACAVALRQLKDRQWTDDAIATRLGVSRSLVVLWRRRVCQPAEPKRRALIDLAASCEYPPFRKRKNGRAPQCVQDASSAGKRR